MLQEINCEKFIEPKITFDEGLNTVLGDNVSTNSIGKSTFLMILDFVFGGDTFLEKDSGSIKQLGHLTFNFSFFFNDKIYYYSRQTSAPELVQVCDSNYNKTTELELSNYKNELNQNYGIVSNSTFRNTVSLYSRIWGKDNYSVDKPLLAFSKEPEAASVQRIIKLFGLYNRIEETEKQLKEKKEAKIALNKAIKQNYIPKITKTQFNKNTSQLESIESEIKDIKDNILKFALNTEELTNKEVLSLKIEKNGLLKEKSLLDNKISRIDQNLNQKSIKSKHLQSLSKFFDNPNEERISEIENFHSKIGSILNRELKSAKQLLVEERDLFTSKIEELDLKIETLTKDVSSPKFIVDKIYELTIDANKVKIENKYYQEKLDIAEKVKEKELNVDTLYDELLKKIEQAINTELISINEKIHTKQKKIPSITLKRTSYNFDHSSNTGTGKSFADLIEFDLSILKLTDLPFVIHDSILFKNIEDIAVDKIIEQYTNFKKQIFISLDGINKFNSQSIKILEEAKVLQLSKDRKLFNKDWS